MNHFIDIILWFKTICFDSQNWRHCWFIVVKSLSDVKYNAIAFSVQLHQYNYTLITIVECYVILYCYWLDFVNWGGKLICNLPSTMWLLVNPTQQCNWRYLFFLDVCLSTSQKRNRNLSLTSSMGSHSTKTRVITRWLQGDNKLAIALKSGMITD